MAEKVLVVDDTVVNQRLLGAILRRAGLECTLATDGNAAMAAVRRERPDLILLDIMMPVKDGFAVCAELKADPATACIPVIFLSAIGETSEKIKGLDLGAVDYVTKPFESSEVVARVRTHLRLQRLNRELRESHERLEEDLRAAADIQRALIPRPGLSLPGVSMAWIFEPCATVGGDVFNAHRLDGAHLAFYILDVNGHGVPPAMVAVCASQSPGPNSGMVARRKKGLPPAITPPDQVLALLDAEYPLERFDRYFTISYLVLHVPSGRLRYSSAGHPLPLYLRGDGSMTELPEGGSIVGLGGGSFEAGEVGLAPGDRLVLYTDGIVEFAAPDGRHFGVARLKEVLQEARRRPLAELAPAVQSALAEFGGGAGARDDVSLLALEYQGPPGP